MTRRGAFGQLWLAAWPLAFSLCPVPSLTFHPKGTMSPSQSRVLPLFLQAASDENEFFVRDADFADLGNAARILTDGFFRDVNFITYNVERLANFLSLESSFPRRTGTDSVSHSMIVGCRPTDGAVLGFVELDCRPTEDPKAAPRPYMCNLAVDKRWLRKGIASALVRECEERVMQLGEEQIFLKVRERNKAATQMYEGLGYSIKSSAYESPVRGQPPDTVVLMVKDLSSRNDDGTLGTMIDDALEYSPSTPY